MVKSENLVEITKTYTEAWTFFKKHWKLVYKVALIYVVLGYVPQFTLESFFTYYGTSESALAGIASFLLMFWQALIGMGGTIAMLQILREKEDAVISFDTFFSGKEKFLTYVWASLRYCLIVLVGLLLFVIPGIIWSIKYAFAFFLIPDKGLGVKEAFDMSAKMTDGIKWKLFWFDIFGFFVVLGGVFLLGVGLFLAIPVVYLAAYMLYNKLLARTKLGIAG